jgi:hypothetical protein
VVRYEGDEVILTLGDPDDAGTGRIVAIDQGIIEWLERRSRRARALQTETGSPHDDGTD